MVLGKSAQRGLSLIELMVAITLGLLLTAAVIQAFLSSRGVFRMQDAMSRTQENGRFAVSFLTQDIRMAGFMGCPSVDRVTVRNIASNLDDYRFAPGTVINGFNDVGAVNAWNAVQNTDVLIIRKASNTSAMLADSMLPGNENIEVANTPGIPEFKPGAVLMITDCVTADAFRAGTVNTSDTTITITHASGGATNELTKPYSTDAEVLAFERVEYFVRATGRTTPAGAPIHALFARKLTDVNPNGTVPDGVNPALPAAPVAYELVEGVENMQLEYGVDTGADRAADVYRSANQVTDWSKVVSVRVNLLLHATEEGAVDSGGALQAQNLTFMGGPTAQDGRLRQVFGATVAIRNRLP